MASRKPQSRTGRSTSGGHSSNRSKTSSGRSKTSSARNRSSGSTSRASGRRQARRKAAQPKSTVSKLVDSATSGKRPVVAAAATAATVIGGVALRARKSSSRGLDLHGIAKQIGKASKNVGKTSKQVAKDVERLGDDVERVGKALS